jgi:hypothetical protein
LAVKLELGLDSWKELFRSFLSSLCTTLKRDIESSFKASIPTRRKLKTKVGLLVTVVVDYLFRMELTIDISGMTKYLFVANLSTMTLSLLKLVIQTLLYHRFSDVGEALLGPK